MLYTKIQPQSFLGSGEEDFKSFYYVIGMPWPSCSMARSHSNKFQYPFDRRPHVTAGENFSCGFREEDILCIYILQGHGQITLRGQNFDCN